MLENFPQMTSLEATESKKSSVLYVKEILLYKQNATANANGANIFWPDNVYSRDYSTL